jgi:hypothetical protein
MLKGNQQWIEVVKFRREVEFKDLLIQIEQKEF